ncbi:MAG: HNH endonuclease [Rubrivivax sp.]
MKTNIRPHGVLLAHHIAWAIHHGTWPTFEIDHINGNRSDNRILNLRELPDNQNSQNLRHAKKNSHLGVLGVSQLGNRYVARITVDRQQQYLGLFATSAEAHQAYVAAKRIHHPGNTL